MIVVKKEEVIITTNCPFDVGMSIIREFYASITEKNLKDKQAR